jgi:hypothetical protein
MRFLLLLALVGCGRVEEVRHLDARTCAQETTCVAGDNCCPTNCNATNDSDCTPMCGNNVVEGDEICDGNCPACANEALTCFTQQTGSAATCDVTCHIPKQTCGTGDTCCPFIASTNGTACTMATDAECRAPAWRNLEVNWGTRSWAMNATTSINIYGISPGDSMLFTTCTPDGSMNTSDTIITQVVDNNGTVFATASDDTTDTGALPRLAGWNCTSTAAAGFPLSTAPANPGGAIVPPNVFRLTVTLGGRNGAAGSTKLFVWWNGTSQPNPG